MTAHAHPNMIILLYLPKPILVYANAPRRRELPAHRHLTNAREQLIGALTAHFELDPGWMTIADAITTS